MKRDRLLMAMKSAVAAVLLLLLASREAVAQAPVRSDPPAVTRIETEFPGFVVRDSSGAIVSLTVPTTLKDEATLAAISRIETIQKLKIRGESSDAVPELTVAGIGSLKNMTNLISLGLACFAVHGLQPGVLSKATEISQLSELQLYYADAPAGEYALISNLSKLRRLDVQYSQNFGDEQLRRVARLPELESVLLIGTSVTQRGTNLLAQTPNLRTIYFRAKQSPQAGSEQQPQKPF